MDLKDMLNASLQGISGMPGYGASSAFEDPRMGGGLVAGGSSSIWVCGVPEEFRNTKFMCNIFGNYGNVMKVKFSRKKPDGALIQMQDPSFAAKCCQYLNGARVLGGRISVKPSKIENITIAPHDHEDQGKDFSGGTEHRYRDPNSKFAQTCLARLSYPTSVLMVANIPEDKMAEVKAYIIESGFTIEEFKEGKKKAANDEENNKEGSARKRSQFAFVEFSSAEEAISALGRLHNTMPDSIGGGKTFRRLSFSFTSKKSF
jgi:RNA recognition motif-containing protein